MKVPSSYWMKVPSSYWMKNELFHFLLNLQQCDETIRTLIKLPYTAVTPIAILDAYVVSGELYFYVLCEDNVVEVVPQRLSPQVCTIAILGSVMLLYKVMQFQFYMLHVLTIVLLVL